MLLWAGSALSAIASLSIYGALRVSQCSGTLVDLQFGGMLQ